MLGQTGSGIKGSLMVNSIEIFKLLVIYRYIEVKR